MNPRSIKQHLNTCVAVLLACAGVALLFGCEAIGVAAYKLSPEPQVPAQYVPPKEPTLVLVENYRNPDSVSLAAEQLTRQITVELRHHDVVPLIDPDSLFELRNDHPEKYAKMNISQIGKTLKARQVLYADLVQFTVESTLASDMVKGHAQVHVRFIDTLTGHTLWPQDVSDGASIGFDTPYLHLTDGASEATVRGQLVSALAVKVGQLFYKWSSDTVEGPKELQ